MLVGGDVAISICQSWSWNVLRLMASAWDAIRIVDLRLSSRFTHGVKLELT